MELSTSLYNGKGFVKIVDVNPSEIPEGFNSRDAVIANDAKISTNTEAFKDNLEVYQFIEKLFEWGHYSPFEQAVLKFRIKAPLVVFWQLDRHRTFVYSSQLRRSGRYTEFFEDDFYVPKYLDQVVLEGLTFPTTDLYAGKALEDVIGTSVMLYREMLANGVAKEAARFVLPAFCLMYEDIVTVNLKNLFHFFALRTDSHAQLEIRELAKEMMTMTKVLFPYSVKIFAENSKPINYDFNEV